MLFTLVLIVALLLIYVGLGLIWMSSDKANPEGFLGFFFMARYALLRLLSLEGLKCSLSSFM